MARFIDRAALLAAALSVGAASPLLARDVTVPRREPSPGAQPNHSRIFDSIETTVTPSEATSCPERFVFVATIKTRAPVTVTYRWDRSDHAIGPIETASWLEAGVHEASTYWLIGSSTGGPVTFDGWERLQILSPEEVSSNVARIRVRCLARDATGLDH